MFRKVILLYCRKHPSISKTRSLVSGISKQTDTQILIKPINNTLVLKVKPLNRSLFTGSGGRGQDCTASSLMDNKLGGIKRFFTNLVGGDKPDDDKDMRKNTRRGVDDKARSDDVWKQKKDDYMHMPLNEKRRYYKTDYVLLEDVPTWIEHYKKKMRTKSKQSDKKSHGKSGKDAKPKLEPGKSLPVDPELNDKVSIWRGDITSLEIDAIVNAANSSLLGGGGVDGAIHRAAGSLLVKECYTLDGCDTGDSKITGGFKLPAKCVIHTVGPMGSGSDELQSCYQTSFSLMMSHELKSIAFPCISTGIYGFPNEKAAHIALGTTRKFLEKNRDKVDRVIFCLFLAKDVEIYNRLMEVYFPVPQSPPGEEAESKEEGTSATKDEDSAHASDTNAEKEVVMETSDQEGRSHDTSHDVEPEREDVRVCGDGQEDPQPQTAPTSHKSDKREGTKEKPEAKSDKREGTKEKPEAKSDKREGTKEKPEAKI